MKILGIETSCDETAASIVQGSPDGSHTILISQSLATSLALHAKTGGIIPEIAARNQVQSIIPVVYAALRDAKISWDRNTPPDIDAIAITYGPGLIGSLLVGVETAKSLSYLWNKPLIPVNHLFGHIYANFIASPKKAFEHIPFPTIALIVSGGHTDLLQIRSHSDITWLGGTRDDAAGEAFDKIGRLLGLSYPAGPTIERLAKEGDSNAYHFPRPLLFDKAYDFSFSGLKTAVLHAVEKNPLTQTTISNICASAQRAITETLVTKTLNAATAYHAKSVIISGGVAANQALRDAFAESLLTKFRSLTIQFFAPEKALCTDNAAMIACAGFFAKQPTSWKSLTANPQLYFD